MTGISPAQEAAFATMITDFFKIFDEVERIYANDGSKKAKWYEAFIEYAGAEKASQLFAAYERRKRSK